MKSPPERSTVLRMRVPGIESVAYTQFSRWSPDGKQIVYDWYKEYNENYFMELRIIRLDGSKPRILYSNEEVLWAANLRLVTGWHTNSGMVQQERQNKCRYGAGFRCRWVCACSQNAGQVLGQRICAFHRTGATLRMTISQKEDSPERDISLLSIDGSREISLVEHPADDRVLGWAPDGRHILFASDRTGTLGAWIIAVADGKPQEVPKLVKSDIRGFEPMGFTSDGSFYHGLREGGQSDIYIAKLDPETGEILVPPRKTTRRFEGHNCFPDYSPDGKYLAYISTRGAMPLMSSPPHVLCIQSLEAGEERELSPKLKRFAVPRWSPDCNSIVVVGQGYNNHWRGIYQINARTGAITVLVPPLEGRKLFPHELSPDGKALFYGSLDFDAEIYRISYRNLESGAEKELYRPTATDNSSFLSCSPDGKWLAFVEWGKEEWLRIMPAAGGEPRELHRCEQEDGRCVALRWTPDGKYILFVIAQGRQKKCSLWRIPMEGGDPQKLGSEMKDHIFGLSIHPDGQHIAFHTSAGWPVEVWAMENFLPGSTAAK